MLQAGLRPIMDAVGAAIAAFAESAALVGWHVSGTLQAAGSAVFLLLKLVFGPPAQMIASLWAAVMQVLMPLIMVRSSADSRGCRVPLTMSG